jgi:cell fate regulator YaaT (PSP1 superfamily)
MACIGCSTTKDGKAAGCKSNGGCDTGGCNRMNAYDWISVLDIDDPAPYPWVEVSFKNGSRKEFYRKDAYLEVSTGDWVVVETAAGQDVGKITLSGDLVRLQMKKKNVSEDRVLYKVVRLATDRDIDHMHQARDMEKLALVKGRAIAKTLNMDMKLGDIEYQADLRKATFFYTADRRIDFRELVKAYAKEFHIKIEMRQIGARQESARIGGIGSCGRELCCSTWLSDFKTVVTSAARYQNLAINQTKLSGQCGRLKCCLNYELDVYMESLDRFPMEIETLVSALGRANLLKTDIFRGVMYYEIESNNRSRESRESQVFGLSPEQVRAHKARNEKGEIPADFGLTISLTATTTASGAPIEEDKGFADVTGEIELPEEKRRRNKNKSKRAGRPSDENSSQRREGQGQSQDRNRNRENRPPQNQSQRPPQGQRQDRDQRPSQPNRNDRQGRPDQRTGDGKDDPRTNQRPEQSTNRTNPPKQRPERGNPRSDPRDRQRPDTRPEHRSDQNSSDRNNNSRPPKPKEPDQNN